MNDQNVSDLLARVGEQLDPPTFDPVVIRRTAQRRRTRDRLLTAATTVAVLGGAGAAATTFSAERRDPSPSASPYLGLNPNPCGESAFTLTIPGAPPQRADDTPIRTVETGESVVLDVLITQDRPGVFRSAEVVVGIPGSTVGAGELSGMPANEARQPGQHVASARTDHAVSGTTLLVSFTPAAPGVYPVFAYTEETLTQCIPGVDPEQQGTATELGVIVVR